MYKTTQINKQPTQYEDVNSIVLLLLQKSQEILRENLLAMYLHGSLATGYYNREKGSDIDFAVIVEKEISGKVIQRLQDMLYEIVQYDPKLSKKLEGSYIPKGWLKNKEPPEKVRPYISGGILHLYSYGYEWVLERFLIRERGIVVFGPPPAQFIEPISASELRRANSKILIRDWQPMLVNSSRLEDDEYQAYAVLTMCRSLFLFENSVITSKPKAAIWAKKRFPRWKELIDAASGWSNGQRFNYLDEVRDFIKFTIEFVDANT